MKNEYKQIIPNWLKWSILIFCLFLIGMIIYGFTLYFNVLHNKEGQFDQSEKIILNETNLVSVENVSRFHGEQLFHVLTGKDKTGDIFYAFLPKVKSDKKQEITMINHANILSKQMIKKEWKDSCQSCQYIDMVPGLVDEQPVWEMKYMDQSGRYVFDYLSMYDGSSVEEFRLKRFYNHE